MMFSALGIQRSSKFLLILMLLAGLAACGGDDGKDGKSAVIGVRTSAPDQLIPKITRVSMSSPLVVDFQVTDANGLGVPGITGGASFTVSKLVPGTNGDTARWSTYMRGADEGTESAQGTTYSDGTLVGHGDGTYTFTFADELEDISGVAFQSGLTHRIGMELRDVEVFGETFDGSGNGVFDFRPIGSGKFANVTTKGVQKRAIVKNESCETCHGGPPPFEFHGGPRNDVDYCVTCHQPGSTDVGTGNTIDFRILVHKIHAGASDAEWCGFGCERLGFPADNFSDVHFPQDVRNCTTCHDPDDPDTPQASNVNNAPTSLVCASCHGDSEVMGDAGTTVVGFDENGLTGPGHAAGAQPNSSCATCHSEGGLVGSVLASHEIPSKIWAQRFEYNIISISQTTPTETPVVTFSITDPTNGDAPYDLENDPAFTNSETSVNLDIAWPTSDYTNFNGTTTGSLVSRPFNQLLVGDLDGFGPGTAIGLGPNVTANGNGTYSVATTIAIPNTGGLDSGAAVIEGHVSGDFDGDGTYDDSVPVTSAVDYFDISGSGVNARREVVDPAKCQNCHGQNDGLAFHGDNRTDNTQVCVVCHNPNQTDQNRRPAAGGIDGLDEQTVDFKYMIHAIHGSEHRENAYVAYGFGPTAHDYSDTHIPRSVAECTMCHLEGTYELPLSTGIPGTSVLGITLDTDADTADSDTDRDPSNDGNLTAIAGTCSSCHDSADALAHMEGSGSVGFGNGAVGVTAVAGSARGDGLVTQAEIDTGIPIVENCAFCHGPGAIADVAEVHEGE